MKDILYAHHEKPKPQPYKKVGAWQLKTNEKRDINNTQYQHCIFTTNIMLFRVTPQ